MDASLSAYWVKFFKGAGFSQDVATKHAVVFSNNRIKPDMLPDLDKPSLKEMGIILMGDMIAILRYAKKVVEETTCERFLVDSEDIVSAPKVNSKPVAKKVVKEIGNKAIVSLASKTEPTKKIVKPLSTTTKKIVTIKKPISALNTNNTNQKQTSIKRKLVSEEAYEDDDDNWNIMEKKAKAINGKDDNIEYTVTVPKSSSIRTSVKTLKKPVEQKRTVFDRLGDSSVTSTTNLADTTPTFNITGVSKDVFKRSTSVFKRLGDIDDKKDHVTSAGILKNGSGISSPGILKNRISPSARTSIITTKRVIPKTTGTMHADHEPKRKIALNNTSRILKLKKEVVSDGNIVLALAPNSEKVTKPSVTSGKLASERLISIPAKARLGTTTAKQVTFSKVATVTHVKKADVFSRLGFA